MLLCIMVIYGLDSLKVSDNVWFIYIYYVLHCPLYEVYSVYTYFEICVYSVSR